MNRYWYFLSLILMLSNIHASPDNTSFAINCYQLETLWQALYGPYHPLKNYIAHYKSAIEQYETLRTQKLTRTNENLTLDKATQSVINELQAQLEAIKDQANMLINQYVITPTTPTDTTNPLALIATPPQYTATPLPTIDTTPSATDSLIQNIIHSIENLQNTQNTAIYSPHAIRDQFILFLSGVSALAIITFVIHQKTTTNTQKLKEWTTKKEWLLTAPHQQNGQVGILTELTCIKNTCIKNNKEDEHI